MRRGDLGWECIISKVTGVVGRVVGDGGCIDLPGGGDGGGRRGDAGAPARSPFSTSSSSSISIYLPALLLHLPLFPPTPTRSTHHPQLNGWLTQGLLGYMLRVFPHTDAHRHVCTCVPGRKWWAPLAIFVLSICYHSPPYVRPPRLAKLPPSPPLSLSLHLLLFSSSSFAPHVYVYIHVSRSLSLCVSLRMCIYIYIYNIYVCNGLVVHVYAFVRRYLLRIGFSPLFVVFSRSRSSSLSFSFSFSLPPLPPSLLLAPPRYLEFSCKKKKYTFLLCLSRKSIHTHYGRYRTRVCPRVTASRERKGRRGSKEKGLMEKSVAARAHAGR